MKKNYSLIIIFLLVVVIGMQLFKPSLNRTVNPKSVKIPNVVIDEKININDYKTITIGDQIWMAENLHVKRKNSYSVNNNSANDLIYGRLYTWEAAMKACPKGWHLPTKEEYKKLRRNFKWKDAGLEIKSSGSSGFNATLSGYYDHNDRTFNGIGVYGQYWTADQYHFTDCAWLMYVDSSFNHMDFHWYLSNDDGFSVRYIKDHGS